MKIKQKTAPNTMDQSVLMKRTEADAAHIWDFEEAEVKSVCAAENEEMLS